MNTSIRRLTRISLMVAVLCITAPLRVDIGPVPITLQTFVVALAGALLGAADGAVATGIYLLLGLAGLPVFAGWMSGPAYFAGPTGGFLVGFVALAALSGARRWWSGLLGLVAVHALGVMWFVFATGMALGQALSVAVWPFLIKDAASVLLAFAFGRTLGRRVAFLNG